MTPAANKDLATAIDYLGAVEVGPEHYGARRRYAFPNKPPGTAPWRTCDASTLIMLYDAHLHYDKQRAFDIFVTRTKKLPTWWSPEQRFAGMCSICGVLLKPDDAAAHVTPAIGSGHVTERITADLETGEEVPC